MEETAEIVDQTVAVTTEKPAAKKKQPKKKPEKPVAPKVKTPTTSPVSPSVSTTGNWISHKVIQGETLFAIAKKYDANVGDIIKWNGLSSNNLSVGPNYPGTPKLHQNPQTPKQLWKALQIM